jgi:hypothetical protein
MIWLTKIYEFISSIGGLKKIIDMIKQFIIDRKVAVLQKEKQLEHDAIEALKAAQTKEEREKAIEDIGKHL